MRTVFSIILFALPVFLFSQTPHGDSIIIRAMQDELTRSMTELSSLDNEDKPTYIKYMIFDRRKTAINASEGVLTPIEDKHTRTLATVICLTDTFINIHSRYRIEYDGLIIQLDRHNITLDTVYNTIRSDIWKGTDYSYKSAVKIYTNYKLYTNLMRLTGSEINPDMEGLNMIRTTHPGIDYRRAIIPRFDKDKLSDAVRIVSEEFNNYPELLNTSAGIAYDYQGYYSVSSENVILQIPAESITFSASARIKDEDGRDEYLYTEKRVWDINKIPAIEEMKIRIKQMAEKAIALSSAPKITEDYTGPILFEDTAVSELFIDLFTFVKGIQKINASHLTRIGFQKPPTGLKIFDPGITVTVSGSKDDPVDYEGFPINKDVKVIENGVLVKQLFGQFSPAPGISPSGNMIIYNKEYGFYLPDWHHYYYSTIRFTPQKGISHKQIRKKLLESAKNAGLDYAYIVRKENDRIVMYRIDINSGNEVLVKGFTAMSSGVIRQLRTNFDINLGPSKPIKYTAASRETCSDFVFHNYDHKKPVEVITPRYILFDNIKLKADPIREKTRSDYL